MDVIQSKDTQQLFYVVHREKTVSFEILKATKESLKCFIIFDKLQLGKYDLISALSLQKAWSIYKSKHIEYKKFFEGQNEFCDFLMMVGQKIRRSEFIQERQETKRELTTEVRDFLLSHDLIDKMDYIQRRTTRDPLIDCEEDLLLFNLVIMSCKAERPITYEHTGPTSSGKTFPAEHAINAYPHEMVIRPAGATGKAPKYNWDYQDEKTGDFICNKAEKCFYFPEKEDSIDAVTFFKPMMSHDVEVLKFQVPISNPVTGVPKTVWFIMDGIASFILLSVGHMENEEMSTRTMKGSPTIDSKKTERIITETFESDMISEVWKPPKDLDLMKDAMYCLKKVHVVNLFAGILGEIFPKDHMKRCRDMNRLRGFIQSCTVLHQYQRLWKMAGDKQVYYATFEDNLMALILVDKLLETTMLGIPSETMKIYGKIKELSEFGTTISYELVHEHIEGLNMHMTLDTLKKSHMQTLLNHGLIKVKEQGTRSAPRSFKINQKYEDVNKVPKLTPIFINEVQNRYNNIINDNADLFSTVNIPPGVTTPKNTIQMKKRSHQNVVAKHLFGLRYFDEKTIHNILWKLCDDDMKDSLFNGNHILTGDRVDTSKREAIIEKRKIALQELESGGYDDVESDTYIDIWRDHNQEEQEKYEEWCRDNS